MKTTKIDGTSFRAIYVSDKHNFSVKQKETINSVKASLINDPKIDRKGRNQYLKLKEKGYDILIEPGNKKNQVKVIAGKFIVTQNGIEGSTDSFVIGTFSKETAPTVGQKIKDIKIKRRLTTIPFFTFVVGMLALMGIVKYNSCTRLTEEKLQKVISDTIKQDTTQNTTKSLNLSKFMK